MRLFEEQFGAAPAVVVRTPGRVNLIGEHTDYNGGAVLPMTTPRGVTVALSPSKAEAVSIAASGFGAPVRRSLLETASGHWSDYALGALLKAREAGLYRGGASIAIESDLPHGAGLSSSAAVIVAVLKAAASASGASPAPVAVAQWAKAVENDFIGVPCGIMDQMAVAVAKEGEALFLDTATLRFETIAVPEGWRFAVVHSGVTRALNEGRYGERRRECDAAAAALGAAHLCLIDDETLAAAARLDDPLGRRARHAASEHRRTLAAAAAMTAGDPRRFGALMIESHASLRDDFEVTTETIDRIVAASLAAGAIGARMTGGGFGGCIVSLVEADRESEWATRLGAAEPGVSFVC